jgi:UDP-glucose 6-dehydrogenase
VGIVGLAFKPGTADLRESPYLAIARAIASRGIGVRAWDPHIRRDDPDCDPSWFAASPEGLADAVIDLKGGERERFARARYRCVAWQPREAGS